MPLKKHHKWIIGSFSSVVVISLIVIAILLNGVIVKQSADYASLNSRINEFQESIQSQINLLSENIITTQMSLEKSQEELSELKVSTGDDFSGIYADAVKSVVIVSTNVGQGTGFIISEEGYVVTNYHVIEGATQAGIYDFEGNGPYQVELIGTNSLMDIALLKINGKFEKLELDDSDDVSPGEKVLVIGNPYGLVFSATTGSVSAVHREGPNGIEAYLQIDAALNPGNSGGPLINKKGKVIGINNFKIGGGESLGFALESNYIKVTVNEISQEALGVSLIS